MKLKPGLIGFYCLCCPLLPSVEINTSLVNSLSDMARI